MSKSEKPGGGKRFKKLSKELESKGVEDPEALAASIGRKKYGKKKFNKFSQAAKNKAAQKVGK